ncbi:MAG: sodium/solute symporter [Planctomycetales bacterium]|nr:sodium/solute symporter [Planctomycetales bacterium]
MLLSYLMLLWANSPLKAETLRNEVTWDRLPDLPDALGVAGPFVGVHRDALIIAGGANFPQPVWESNKKWTDQIHVLKQLTDSDLQWIDGGRLPQPIAYGATVSTPLGVVCLGGNDATTVFQDVLLIQWNAQLEQLDVTELPKLPEPRTNAQAAIIGQTIYLVGGQSGLGLETASDAVWTLDLSMIGQPENFLWRELAPMPGGARAFHITLSQHDGFEQCLYIISGRRQRNDQVDFLSDVWQFSPRKNEWRERTGLPAPRVAAPGIAYGQYHLLVLGGDDGTLFHRTDELRDEHPGFPKVGFAYHTVTDTWTELPELPSNQVTTQPVWWQSKIILASGEVRPRVRTPHVWSISLTSNQAGFGWINYVVLVCYLLGMVVLGVFFAWRTKTTDDYFRGGKRIPWWAAGCSIFATMLSSLTYTGIPAKAFVQDWVLAIGNFMIPVVAFLAVYVALPFYRRIDATSAYEYLELRFNRAVRLFGSASFILFHIFRMAVVMSLTGLALAVATPLTPLQSVLLMGVLSIVYCTAGGIEAVIWTDTIQTIVLLIGALVALTMLVNGSGLTTESWLEVASNHNKLRFANWNLDATNSQIAIWAIVLGAIGQNVSSYTADQAIVQRYTTTASQTLAARSIWTNAVMTVPATILFFGMGTALFVFYHSHPEKLDPTIVTDQIFPMFISREMPIGLAGLIVAGIFSAAQSTVSTSMNSLATTIVTDFLRPFGVLRTESNYLKAARWLTFSIGILGTVLALWFIDPKIASLFDAFIKVIGLFMGVLGGLFLLGVLTRRANAVGALTGAILGSLTLICVWQGTKVNGYLYTFIGISVCFVTGYMTSLCTPAFRSRTEGLTIHD